jgi:arylsulfatase A-like enzyme
MFVDFPLPCRGCKLRADYAERLVETAREQLEDPVVIFTADHGEEFREHGQFSHNTVHDEGIHVPLIIDDGSGSGTFEELVGLMDLPPTIASYAERTIPEGYLGYDIRRLIDGDDWERDAVIGNWGSIEDDRLRFFYRDSEWLYIKQDNEELFNVVEDPGETENVIEDYHEAATEIRERVSKCEREIKATHQTLDSVTVDEDVNERLKMLGYKDE